MKKALYILHIIDKVCMNFTFTFNSMKSYNNNVINCCSFV